MLWNTYRRNRDSELIAKGRRMVAEDEIDRPLNYYSDQAANIKGRLRDLNINKGINTSIPLVLLTAGLAFMVRRRFSLGSLFLGGFLLNAYMVGRRVPAPNAHSASDPYNADVERYALKAERGDYGHLEVIPFK